MSLSCYSTNGRGYHEIGTGIHRSGAHVHTGTSAEQQWDITGYGTTGYGTTGYGTPGMWRTG
jgi:hypothetical protein